MANAILNLEIQISARKLNRLLFEGVDLLRKIKMTNKFKLMILETKVNMGQHFNKMLRCKKERRIDNKQEEQRVQPYQPEEVEVGVKDHHSEEVQKVSQVDDHLDPKQQQILTQIEDKLEVRGVEQEEDSTNLQEDMEEIMMVIIQELCKIMMVKMIQSLSLTLIKQQRLNKVKVEVEIEVEEVEEQGAEVETDTK